MAKKKILIIDDSVETRLEVSARLKKHQYDTVFAAISHMRLSPTRYASRGTRFRAISRRTGMNNAG